MKCIDCDKDACMLFNGGYQLDYAFCKKCIKKRFRGGGVFSNSFDINDLNEIYFAKDDGGEK